MTIKKNYEELQAALIEGENINVSKSSDLKNFFILIISIIGIIVAMIFVFNVISDIFISTMSDDTQIKIEKSISIKQIDLKYPNVTTQELKELKNLNNIKSKIIAADTTLKNKSNFPITIVNNSEINACILPNGIIFITSGLLKQKYTEEELAFVLAHEIGHYANRDHLRIFSRQILSSLIFITISGNTNSFDKFLNGVTLLNNLVYSRKQEAAADEYAGRILIKIYGTNNGGKTFIKKIKDNENTSNFLHYFSSHPSWNNRLNILNKQM